MPQSRPFARVLLALALPFVALADHPARACGNEMRLVEDSPTRVVAQLDRRLREGDYYATATLVLHSYPTIRTTPAGASLLEDRVLRIMALANARTRGELSVGWLWSGITAGEKRRNFLWALETMRALAKLRPDHPAMMTDLAEVLAYDTRTPAHLEEARALLEGLAKRDLVTSSHGYHALAKLREIAGDLAGREAAVARCEAMSRCTTCCRQGLAPTPAPSKPGAQASKT